MYKTTQKKWGGGHKLFLMVGEAGGGKRPSRRKGIFKYRTFFHQKSVHHTGKAKSDTIIFFHKKSVHHTEGGVLVTIKLQENRVLCPISIQKSDLF